VFTAAPQSITATVSSNSAPDNGTVTVGSTGSSGGGTITLALDGGGNGNTSSPYCNFVGGVLSINRPGTCYVYASIAADGTYQAATSADQTVVFNGVAQTITATVSSNSTPWNTTVTVGSTGSLGGGTISLSLDTGSNGSDSSSACSLIGTSLTATGPGTCYVYASIASDSVYNAATSADQTVTFTTANQTITATVSSNSTPWNTTVTVGSTGSLGGGTISLSLDTGSNGSDSSSACSLIGTSLTATGPGTCYVYASIAADGDYNTATSADQTVTFTTANQTITATVSSNSTPWNTTVTVGSTGSLGGGTISLSLDTSSNGNISDGVCSLIGTSLTATGPGTCYVYASIAADGDYNTATSADQTVTFTTANQTITATVSSNSTPWNTTVTVGSTGSLGGGTITLALDGGGNGNTSSPYCNFVGGVLSINRPGTCYVYASIAADGDYNTATSADQTVTFTTANQTITATVSSNSTPWNTTVTVGSTGSLGGGTISLSLDTSSNGNILGRRLQPDRHLAHRHRPGHLLRLRLHCGRRRLQHGHLGRPDGHLHHGQPDDHRDGQLELDALEHHGHRRLDRLPGWRHHQPQPGHQLQRQHLGRRLQPDRHLAHRHRPGHLLRLRLHCGRRRLQHGQLGRPDGHLHHGQPDDHRDGQLELDALEHHGHRRLDRLPGRRHHQPQPGHRLQRQHLGSAYCSLIGTSLTATGPGTCYVYASIAADGDYNTATSADQTVTFTTANQTITATVSSNSTPWNTTVTVGSTGSLGGGTISLSLDTSSNGNISDGVCSLIGTSLTATGPGTCYVYASIAADGDYNTATSADQTVTFTTANQTITATVSSNSTPWNTTVTVGSTGSLGGGTISLSLDTGSNGNTSSPYCNFVGRVLSINRPGTCYVYASIAADGDYNTATSADQTVTFTTANQTITATVSSNSTPWNTTVTVGSTGSLGGGTISLSLDTSSNGNTSRTASAA
jgi:hypothetical protein